MAVLKVRVGVLQEVSGDSGVDPGWCTAIDLNRVESRFSLDRLNSVLVHLEFVLGRQDDQLHVLEVVLLQVLVIDALIADNVADVEDF